MKYQQAPTCLLVMGICLLYGALHASDTARDHLRTATVFTIEKASEGKFNCRYKKLRYPVRSQVKSYAAQSDFAALLCAGTLLANILESAGRVRRVALTTVYTEALLPEQKKTLVSAYYNALQLAKDDSFLTTVPLVSSLLQIFFTEYEAFCSLEKRHEVYEIHEQLSYLIALLIALNRFATLLANQNDQEAPVHSLVQLQDMLQKHVDCWDKGCVVFCEPVLWITSKQDFAAYFFPERSEPVQSAIESVPPSESSHFIISFGSRLTAPESESDKEAVFQNMITKITNWKGVYEVSDDFRSCSLGLVFWQTDAYLSLMPEQQRAVKRQVFIYLFAAIFEKLTALKEKLAALNENLSMESLYNMLALSKAVLALGTAESPCIAYYEECARAVSVVLCDGDEQYVSFIKTLQRELHHLIPSKFPSLLEKRHEECFRYCHDLLLFTFVSFCIGDEKKLAIWRDCMARLGRREERAEARREIRFYAADIKLRLKKSTE